DNGASHPVRIDLPPGSYRAEFRWEQHTQPSVATAPAAEPPSADPPVLPRPVWLIRSVIVGAMAVLVVAGGFSWWRWGTVRSTSADASSSRVSTALSNVPMGGEDLRMIAGSTSSYVDRNGRTWSP